MKLRTGSSQTNGIPLLVQLGDEPSFEQDEIIGLIFDPARADLIVAVCNGERPPPE